MNLYDEGLKGVEFDAPITNEDFHQRVKWGNQEHSLEKWFIILSEEVGEMAKAILENDLPGLLKESNSVATLAIKIYRMVDLYQGATKK